MRLKRGLRSFSGGRWYESATGGRDPVSLQGLMSFPALRAWPRRFRRNMSGAASSRSAGAARWIVRPCRGASRQRAAGAPCTAPGSLATRREKGQARCARPRPFRPVPWSTGRTGPSGDGRTGPATFSMRRPGGSVAMGARSGPSAAIASGPTALRWPRRAREVNRRCAPAREARSSAPVADRRDADDARGRGPRPSAARDGDTGRPRRADREGPGQADPAPGRSCAGRGLLAVDRKSPHRTGVEEGDSPSVVSWRGDAGRGGDGRGARAVRPSDAPWRGSRASPSRSPRRGPGWRFRG